MENARLRVRSILLTVALALGLLVTSAAPALAAPVPKCSYHFNLIRHGTEVRITGVELHLFSREYMLVYVGAKKEVHGPFNASPFGGANFTINTGSKARTAVVVSLTNDENTYTYCSSRYDA